MLSPRRCVRLAAWLAILLVNRAAAGSPAGPERGPLAPQVSASIAIGKSSDGVWFGHLWGGVGVHWVGGPADGAFLIGGAEVDLRGDGSEGDPVVDREPIMGGSRDFGSPPEPEDPTEVWLMGRAGGGSFGGWPWIPQASIYLLAGMRATGPEEAPRIRVGGGASVPAAIQLAYLGIPTMIEAGVDVAGSGEPSRAFLRAGWNF